MTIISYNGESLDLRDINLQISPLPVNLFNTTAQQAARIIGSNMDSNNPRQLRKFYDELVMWHEKVKSAKDKEAAFKEHLPFILMLNAKAVYAKGRNQKDKTNGQYDRDLEDRTGLIDRNFLLLFQYCTAQLTSFKNLQTFKLFMEAFMGFYKVERPKE